MLGPFFRVVDTLGEARLVKSFVPQLGDRVRESRLYLTASNPSLTAGIYSCQISQGALYGDTAGTEIQPHMGTAKVPNHL